MHKHINIRIPHQLWLTIKRSSKKTVGIPIGLPMHLFLQIYFTLIRSRVYQELLRKREKKLAQSFNYTFRYIDDVLSLNNKNFSKFLHLIYPVEPVVKILQILLIRIPILTFTLNMTLMEPWQPHFMTNVTILTFLPSNIPFSTVTSHHLLHMVFTCRSWFDIREPVIPISI